MGFFVILFDVEARALYLFTGSTSSAAAAWVFYFTVVLAARGLVLLLLVRVIGARWTGTPRAGMAYGEPGNEQYRNHQR